MNVLHPQATKEMGKWTMFSSNEKWEKAAGHYRKAGNFFKASMKCKRDSDQSRESCNSAQLVHDRPLQA